MSTWRERGRRLAERIPLWHHFAPLAVLTFLHMAVLERTMRGADGIPERVIPYDFSTSYARFLIFISDTLRAGVLPIWFPYSHAGSQDVGIRAPIPRIVTSQTQNVQPDR